MPITKQTKAERARNLRYKKGIAQGFNISEILDELMEISAECDNIRYIAEGDEDTLIAALDGNEEDAYEFRMMFSDLSQESENLYDRLNEEYVSEYFDEFFCRVAGGCMQLLGYDSYEEDYFALTSFESGLAQNESEKRLMKLTKQEILQTAEQCFGVATAFLNVRYKFDYLKATFDILRDENNSFIETIKDIEKAYEKASDDEFNPYSKSTNEFDKLIKGLPERTWIE